MVLIKSKRESCYTPWLNIIFPVRNEEKRIQRGISETVSFFDEQGFEDYIITIVDNESTDRTFDLAEQLSNRYAHVRCVRIDKKGVGAAFREAIAMNDSPIVGYMDIDLATDLHHLLDVINMFQEDEDLQFVNGSRWAEGYGSSGRGVKRIITSVGLTFVLKISLGMRASDAICGFKFFRKDSAEELVSKADSAENGWFYIIEMLLIAERSGMNMRELSVVWKDDGCSSVEVGPVIKNYLIQISKLRKRFRLHEDSRKKSYVRTG